MLAALAARCQIHILRYNDDFSYLEKDSATRKGTEHLKYIPLAGIGTVSFGGELREQLQFYHNLNFGDVPVPAGKPGTWQLLHRAMIHTNIEIGRKGTVFAQLGSTFRFFNPNPAVPEIDENHLSMHQLFAEYRFAAKWKIRVGRQELSHGSHRLITFREGPNTRLAFDAAIVRHQSAKRKIDVLTMSPVISMKGVFDDQSYKDVLTGFYATERVLPRALVLDYYMLNFQSRRRKYNHISGNENRYVAGIRAVSESRPLNYEIELTYQLGRFGNQAINAYSVCADLNYVAGPGKKVIIGIAGNYSSGDRSSTDDQLNTYNALFSKPPYGLTAGIGAANIVTANPYMKLTANKRSSMYAGAWFMHRQSSNDGMYAPGGLENRPRPGTSPAAVDKRIGTLLSIETTHTISRNFSCAVDVSHFFAGSFIRQTGNGKDIDYVALKLSYKF